jgi:hypothetical protein
MRISKCCWGRMFGVERMSGSLLHFDSVPECRLKTLPW